MTKKNKHLIIWDCDSLPKNTQNVLLWNKRSDKLNSIINFIDNNSKKIKHDTLELFKNFSKSKINNSNIIDYYNLENNFSYWNLSFFIEKNFYKKNFFDIIKISALDYFIKKKKISYIILHTSNKRLVDFLSDYCSKNKTIFKFQILNSKKKDSTKVNFKNLYRIIIFLFNRINFKKNQLSQKNIFFSYFENKDNDLNKSIYWSNLFDKIKSPEVIQIFLPSKNFSNIRKVKNKKFNFLDYELNLFIFFKIIFSFIKINFLNQKINLFGNKIFMSNSINYWPIIKPHWEDSFKSINLFKNLYYYHLIKEIVFKKINRHKKIFYLFENQPWERCLCFFYKKKFTKKKLYGISHTPIRFWDLRFFNSKKINLKNYSPNKISFVNKYSQDIYKRDFVGQKKIKLEALRYNNLKIKFDYKKEKKTLIIGDYLQSENLLIKSVITRLSSTKKNFLYLCHPTNSKNIYQNFKFLKSKEELESFNIEKVIVPHMSTSAIEYLLTNKNIIVFLNDNMPIMSPLFMSKIKVKYAFDLKSLKKSLSKKQHNLYYKLDELKPFRTNKELIYWKRLLLDDFKK